MELQSLPPSPRKRTPIEIERAVLYALAVREVRARVQGRWIGLLWMLFEPLAHVTLMLSIYSFTQARSHPGMELPVFLVIGMMPFFMFRNVARRLPQSVTAARSLFAYRQVHPFDALLARAAVEIGLSSAVYVVALAVLGWLGYHWFPNEPLELMVVSIVLLAFAVGLGFVFAVAQFGRPRVETVIGLMFLPLYLLSGVIISLHNLPAEIQALLLWNPVLHLIELSRTHFIANYQPMDGVNLAYPAAWALGTCALGMALYRVYRHRFTGG